MHAAGSQGIQSISSRKSTYALSENEKVLSAIARWATYASMKVSQAAFGDPLFVAMLPLFLGLFLVLPVLGHATWHLYRRVVSSPGG